MAWQRKIPFGYMIRNGKAGLHPVEADAVKRIYQMYLDGLSYQQIANEMERQGVKYHQHTDRWNKHMVKRMLENETYLGTGMYPRLITSEVFMKVCLQRAGKASGTPCPDHIAPIRRKAVCARCGAAMARDTKSYGVPRWRCENPDCAQTVRVEDPVLRDSLTQRLQALAEKPSLLIPPYTRRQDGPSMDAIRIQNELNLAFNRGAESAELIRALIFAAAAESYSAIPDPTPGCRLDCLRKRLDAGPADEGVLQELMDTAVKAIRLGNGGALELELINGTIFTSDREERTA